VPPTRIDDSEQRIDEPAACILEPVRQLVAALVQRLERIELEEDPGSPIKLAFISPLLRSARERCYYKTQALLETCRRSVSRALSWRF
jgi:hypothetical protein